jgi:HD-GYP domain-containing protein (c-di-GMP phosphodiesterase class II)
MSGIDDISSVTSPIEKLSTKKDDISSVTSPIEKLSTKKDDISSVTSPIDDISTKKDDISSVTSPSDKLSKKTVVKKLKKKTKNVGKKAASTEEDKFLDELLSSTEYEEARKQRVERLLAGYNTTLENAIVVTSYKDIPLHLQEKQKNKLLQKVEQSVQDIFACNQELRRIGYRFSDYVPFDQYTMMHNKAALISTLFNRSCQQKRFPQENEFATQVISDAWKKIESLHLPGNILHGVDKTAGNSAVKQPNFTYLEQIRTDLHKPHRILNSMTDDEALDIIKGDLEFIFKENKLRVDWYMFMGEQLRHRLKDGKINSDVLHLDFEEYIESEPVIKQDPLKKSILVASLVDFVIRS